MISRWVRWACIAVTCALSACASIDNPSPKDPFERFNRAMYSFNDGVDKVLLKPVAKGYAAVVPGGVRECVGNAFSNLKVPFSALNNLMQGKPVQACEDIARFLINSTLGLGGCFDIASEAAIPNHREDFGQTLGYWGVPAGPYLVLPLLGSSTVRDAIAQFTPPDRDMVRKDIDHVPTRNTALGLRLVDYRAGLLKASDTLDKLDVDPYSFVRDAHLSRRQNAVYDGDPPDEDTMDKEGKVLNKVSSEDLKSGVESFFSTFSKLFR